jgi:phosphoserine phosphatase RsbU/P
MINNDSLGFVIGDVSGKGIPAAIFMAVSRTLIRATGLKGMSAGECMEYVNNLLCNESVSSMFVTVFYGILNTKTGVLEYANAGHNPPYLLRNNNQIEKLESAGDIVLGCFDSMKFASRKVQLNPNDGILLYTDGVTEAFNKEEEEYDEERLEKLLPSLQPLTVAEIVNGVCDDVNLFVQGFLQSDDITLLALKYFG